MLGGASGVTAAGPASVAWIDDGGDVIETRSYELVPSSQEAGAPVGEGVIDSSAGYDFAFGRERSRSRVHHSPIGILDAVDVWHDLANGNSELRSGFNRTSYAYDSLGRTIEVTNANGTIRQTDFDVLDRAVAEWIGTSTAAMQQVSSFEYDGGNEGNSLLTKQVQYNAEYHRILRAVGVSQRATREIIGAMVESQLRFGYKSGDDLPVPKRKYGPKNDTRGCVARALDFFRFIRNNP